MAAATVVAGGDPEHILWHCRLGHPSEGALAKLVGADAVTGLERVRKGGLANVLCAACVKGKAHRSAIGRSKMSERAKATRPLGRAHSDVKGPLPESIGGKRYLHIIADEKTRHVWGWCHRHKSDTAGKVIEWRRAVATQQPEPLSEFHSDSGGEFINGELRADFTNAGVTHTTTVPGTSAHNGISERLLRTLMDTACTMMEGAGAPPECWARGGHGRHPRPQPHCPATGWGTTPAQLWHRAGAKPGVEHLRVWGCDAWMHVPAGDRSKIDSKARLLMFVGYDAVRLQGYRLLDVETRRVVVSRDVRFDEQSRTQAALLKAQQEGPEQGALSFRQSFQQQTPEDEVRFVEMLSLEEFRQRRSGGWRCIPKGCQRRYRSRAERSRRLPPEQHAAALPPAAGPAKAAKVVRFVLDGVPLGTTSADVADGSSAPQGDGGGAPLPPPSAAIEPQTEEPRRAAHQAAASTVGGRRRRIGAACMRCGGDERRSSHLRRGHGVPGP